MNIFVLCTGRCGSVTFARACQHITNFTADHESLAHRMGQERLKYSENHIEIDNRLSWYLGQLDKKYGDNAYYVHLQRNRIEVIESFVKRKGFGIMKAFSDGLVRQPSPDLEDTNLLAAEIVDTGTENIRHFLKDKTHQMEVHLENIERDFSRFWNWIGAEGDLKAASECWMHRNNASTGNIKKSFSERVVKKMRRFVEGDRKHDR